RPFRPWSSLPILGPPSALGSLHTAKRFIGLAIGVRTRARDLHIMHHRIALLASTTVDIAIYLVLGLLWPFAAAGTVILGLIWAITVRSRRAARARIASPLAGRGACDLRRFGHLCWRKLPPSCIDIIGLLVLSALVATNQPTIVGLWRSSCVTIFFLFF